MSELIDLLNRKVIFHCSRRDGREEKKDFVVVHTLSAPLDTDNIPEWITPSLLEIYKQWHGLRLFQPNHEAEDGFRLFSIDEVTSERNELRRILGENVDRYKEGSKFEDLDPWLEGLIPIAEVMSSGDKFALDTYHRNESGECPIVFLDHEVYYGGRCDPETTRSVASDTSDLLRKVLNEPLKYVAANWIGGDYSDQWYPDSTSIA